MGSLYPKQAFTSGQPHSSLNSALLLHNSLNNDFFLRNSPSSLLNYTTILTLSLITPNPSLQTICRFPPTLFSLNRLLFYTIQICFRRIPHLKISISSTLNIRSSRL